MARRPCIATHPSTILRYLEILENHPPGHSCPRKFHVCYCMWLWKSRKYKSMRRELESCCWYRRRIKPRFARWNLRNVDCCHSAKGTQSLLISWLGKIFLSIFVATDVSSELFVWYNWVWSEYSAGYCSTFRSSIGWKWSPKKIIRGLLLKRLRILLLKYRVLPPPPRPWKITTCIAATAIINTARTIINLRPKRCLSRLGLTLSGLFFRSSWLGYLFGFTSSTM